MSRKGNGRKHGGQDDGWGVFGGYMAAKKQKLDEQFLEDQPGSREISCAESKIFQGVAIFVNGYTVPSSDELKRLMMVHGGRFIHYYRKTEVTHIIATNLPQAKIRKLNDEKVVRPEWILDSIKAGLLLSYELYQLYGNRTSLQKSLSFLPSSSSAAAASSISTTSKSEPSMPLDISGSKVTGNKSNLQDDIQEGDAISFNINKEVLRDMEDVEQKLKDVKDLPQKNIDRNSNCGDFTKKLELPLDKVAGRGPAKAGDPKFVAEFYSHSRLHHIASWGAEFKDLVMQLQNQGDGSFPARDALRKNGVKDYSADSENYPLEGKEDVQKIPGSSKAGSSKDSSCERYIMHVDMDCFFVSVGLINRPELQGKPVAVTHSRGNGMQQVNLAAKQYEQDYYEKKYGMSKSSGMSDKTEKMSSTFNSAAEIASCSYEARAAGVRNGMFMGQAKKLCPDLQTIPYDFDLYKEVAQKLYEIVARYTHDIEAVSCDEMFVDISELLSDTKVTPLEFSSLLRNEIFKETKCNASVGIAHNILLARMSTRIAKPNGQHYLEVGQEVDFIKSQPVGDLPGVGWSMKRRLEALSVNSCGDLQLVPMATLQKEFGAKTGKHLYNLCRGQDDRAIQAEKQRKSVSAEINYGIRFTKESEAVDFVSEVVEEVHRRLLKISVKGKTITLKMKVRKPDAPKESSKFLGHGICNNVAKSLSFAQATDDLKVIKESVLSLLRQMKIQPCDMRGVGVQINKLVPESGEVRHPAAIGTKSLKDFVTIGDKKPSEIHIPDVRPQVKKSMPKTIMNFLQKQPKQNNDILKPMPEVVHKSGARIKQSVIIQEENPLPKFPTMSPSLPKEEPAKKSDFYPSSVSEIDTSVLDALPPDIRLQIQNSFLTKKLDVNQKIPLTSTPVHLKSTAVDPMQDQPTTSRAVMKYDRECSFTQREELLDLDPSVLKELPEDIVQELMANQQKLKERQRLAEEPVEALPNLSQIEPSCLDALPPDLKEELKQAYLQKDLKQKEQIYQQSPVESSPAKPSFAKPSPCKLSPGKISPFANAKQRGKLRKGSPRKLFERNQPKIRDIIRKSPTKENMGVNKNCDAVATTPNLKVDSEVQVENFKDDNKVKTQRANLSGATELADVKSLLREWMDTCEFPRDDDLGHVIAFLQDLVMERNLVKVDLLLKAFKRYANRIDTDKWMVAYNTVVALVQDRIRQVFNSQLKIS
ncbi:DNA repair protein REV1-like [Anneissia japonica]|uniref:DNA repair protein REV1-like n=1 Tax=Anneissia japonica TaxID=1529436 RepID=UPI001425AE76|nr:DNA repair protein REV1-like [Anneissia japonica]